MKKVGVFAGTFDPVHDGHIEFALRATEHLDKVFLLVEPRPRRKQGVKSLEHRFEMVKLATKEHSSLGVIKLNQARFTPRDTMPLLAERFKGAEVHLLFGDDVISRMVDNISDWPYVEELFKTSNIVIGTRKHQQEELSSKIQLLKNHGLDMSHKFVNVSRPQFSSSKVRLLFKNSETVNGVDSLVKNYIKENGLYSTSGASCSK